MDDVVQFLEDGNVMDPPEDTPPAIYNTMLSCWHLEPEDRPTFVDLKCMLESFKREQRCRYRQTRECYHVQVLLCTMCIHP